MSNEQDLDQVRATAESVLEKARNDDAFRASLVEDPVSRLVEAGLAQDDAEYVGLYEWRDPDAETTGFARYNGCDRYTCLITICPNVPYTNSCGLTTNKSGY